MLPRDALKPAAPEGFLITVLIVRARDALRGKKVEASRGRASGIAHRRPLGAPCADRNNGGIRVAVEGAVDESDRFLRTKPWQHESTEHNPMGTSCRVPGSQRIQDEDVYLTVKEMLHAEM